MNAFFEGLLIGVGAVYYCAAVGWILLDDVLAGIPKRASLQIGWVLLCSVAFGAFCWVMGFDSFQDSMQITVGYSISATVGLTLVFRFATYVRRKRLSAKQALEPAPAVEPSNETLAQHYDSPSQQMDAPHFPPYPQKKT